jgi:hypothetical protein
MAQARPAGRAVHGVLILATLAMPPVGDGVTLALKLKLKR